jgi:hypothetical protein
MHLTISHEFEIWYVLHYGFCCLHESLNQPFDSLKKPTVRFRKKLEFFFNEKLEKLARVHFLPRCLSTPPLAEWRPRNSSKPRPTFVSYLFFEPNYLISCSYENFRVFSFGPAGCRTRRNGVWAMVCTTFGS